MSDVHDRLVGEETKPTRQELEEKAANWFYLWALAHDTEPDSWFAEFFGASEDLYQIGGALREMESYDHADLGEDWKKVRAAEGSWAGLPFDKPGRVERELRRPRFATRRQVQAAAGVLAETYDTLCQISTDTLLNTDSDYGALGREVEALRKQFRPVMLELGRVLRQEGDLLQVGEEKTRRWLTREEIEEVDGKPAIGVVQ